MKHKLATSRWLRGQTFLLAWSIGLLTAAGATPSNVSLTAPRASWTATWISHPTAPLREPLTLHFRRSFTVAPGTHRFVIHVSADNRFVLYLNGNRIGDGPARGDLEHWRYESFDLGPRLKDGENILSATVWNFGIYAPTAQITDRLAFLVQGDTADEAVVNTDQKWMVETEPGQIAYPRQPNGFWQYMAVGPGEALHASDFDWNWQTEPTAGPQSNGRWVPAASAIRESIYPAASIAGSRGTSTDNPWRLVPDLLPPMSYVAEAAGKTVRTDLPGSIDFPDHQATVPPHQHVHVLLDRSTMTTAYPVLTFSGGKGSRIDITYAEALYDAQQKKGDRNAVGTRMAFGMRDLVLPDGGEHRRFETLWWRAWRFMDLEITTGDSPLRLDGLSAYYTAYPFKQKAHFTSNDAELNQIWNIGWHTLELDAHETYMDTPYYEQLQYVGDSRIEAMITYAVTGDDRLPREAIRAFDDSRRADGLTASRWPSSLQQFIPPFSLLWIGMLNDFATYRDDRAFVREALPGVRGVLHWFAAQQEANGLLHELPDWSFVDWTPEGMTLPTYDEKGQSCLVTLEYIAALKDAAGLETLAGDPGIAADLDKQREHAAHGVYEACWDEHAGLLADSPAKNVFSQHSNTLGVLYDVIPQEKQAAVMQRILDARSENSKSAPALIPASYYFDYYVVRALVHAGMQDRYFDLLDRWRQLARMHFSTWPETPGTTRSDSHAWSAHPTIDLLTIVAGISPSSKGFHSVRIEPHLGGLQTLDAAMPHDLGLIHVRYRQDRGHLSAIVELPPGLLGVFAWKGQETALHSGSNLLELSP